MGICSFRNFAILVIGIAVIVANFQEKLAELGYHPKDERVGDVEKIDHQYITEHVKGKNAVVTGATGAIGSGIAISLAAHGANVVLVGRDEEKLRKLMKEMGARAMSPSQEFRYFAAKDLSTVKGTSEVISYFVAEAEKYNNAPFIDLLILAQGLLPGWSPNVTEEGLTNEVGVSVLGKFYIIEHLRPYFVKGAKIMSILASTQKSPEPDVHILEDIISGRNVDYVFFRRVISNSIAHDTLLYQLSVKYPTLHFVGTHPGFVESMIASSLLPEWALRSFNAFLTMIGIGNTPEACGDIHLAILTSKNVEQNQISYFNHRMEGRKTATMAYDSGFGTWLWTFLVDHVEKHSRVG